MVWCVCDVCVISHLSVVFSNTSFTCNFNSFTASTTLTQQRHEHQLSYYIYNTPTTHQQHTNNINNIIIININTINKNNNLTNQPTQHPTAGRPQPAAGAAEHHRADLLYRRDARREEGRLCRGHQRPQGAHRHAGQRQVSSKTSSSMNRSPSLSKQIVRCPYCV